MHVENTLTQQVILLSSWKFCKERASFKNVLHELHYTIQSINQSIQTDDEPVIWIPTALSYRTTMVTAFPPVEEMDLLWNQFHVKSRRGQWWKKPKLEGAKITQVDQKKEQSITATKIFYNRLNHNVIIMAVRAFSHVIIKLNDSVCEAFKTHHKDMHL